MAFRRFGDAQSALFVVALSGGEPVALGDWNSGLIGGLAWTPDGREILVARPATSGRRLVRVKVAARAPEVPLAGVPQGSALPSVSHFRAGHTYRLAVASGQQDIGLRLVDLRAPRQGDTITSNSPFCDATRMDTPGRFSPDGRQVAFTSDRSGNQQLWVANVDGSALRSVTELPDATVSLGSWSPDGRSLAFDATMGGKRQIYVVPVGGGALKRVTDGTATEIDPEWSRDGRWIYIVFVFAPGLGGAVDFARAPDVLQVYDFADRRIRTLGTLAFRVGPFGASRFLTVSRDGNWAVASHVDRWERDIHVVDTSDKQESPLSLPLRPQPPNVRKPLGFYM